jgi:hypothetical protein
MGPVRVEETYGLRIGTLPLWFLFIGTVLVCLLSLEGAFRISRLLHEKKEAPSEATLRSIVSGMLVLLALVLGFTVQNGANQSSSRRQATLADALSIRRAWIRIDLLPMSDREEFRALLREYLSVRLEASSSHEYVKGVVRSEQIQNQLWVKAAELERAHPGSEEIRLFTRAVDDLIEAHLTRISAARSRTPTALWTYIYVLVVLSMASVGYHLGVAGSREAAGTMFLALAFSVVMLLIADLDEPTRGGFKTNVRDLEDLKAEMR